MKNEELDITNHTSRITGHGLPMTDHASQITPKVAIIILNWNGWKDIIECLESLYQITYPNYDAIFEYLLSEKEIIYIYTFNIVKR